MKIEVLALGIVKRDDSPAIHYPPGVYDDVSADVEAQLRAQGVLAGEAAPTAGADAPGGDEASDAPGQPGKKGKVA